MAYRKIAWFILLLLPCITTVVAHRLLSQESTRLHAERGFVIQLDAPLDQAGPPT